jgi:hypothetical protein
MRRAAKGFTSCPKPSTTHNKNLPTTTSTTQHATTPQQTINSQPQTTQIHSSPQSIQNQTIHNHPNHNLPSYYLYEVLPSKYEFCTMSEAKAIEQICIVLPISEEEVQQTNLNIKTPHNWHDIATEIINNFNNSYIDDTNMNDENY